MDVRQATKPDEIEQIMTRTSGQFLTQGLCGWYFASERSFDPKIELNSMKEALCSTLPDCQLIKKNHAWAAIGSSCVDTGRVTAAIAGYPEWKNSYLSSVATERNHAVALAAAYAEDKDRFLEKLSGAFSFMIVDEQESRLLAGIDRIGQFPLYYCEKENGILLGTTAKSVLAHSSINRNLLEQGIFDYVYFHMVPSPVSIFDGLKKLPAGHYLDFHNSTLNIKNYWQPSFTKPDNKNFTLLGKEMKEILTNSVKKHLSGSSSIGAFLSGGLDSSTVSGVLSEVNPDTSHAYSIGFSAKGYDEMAYARITAKHFGIQLHEYYVTPEDVVDAVPIIATSYDEPFGNSSALPAYFCAKLAAKDGVTRLLAGDGGDEIFAGNERYRKQKIFEIYSKAPNAVKRLIFEPLLNKLPGSIAPINKIRSYVQQANIPLPDRLQSYNFLHRHDVKEIFSDDFLASISTSSPLELQNSVYYRLTDASTLDRMLYLDWQFTLADNDLRKVSHMCALAGVEVVYPMLDDDLVEFSCRVPDHWKLKGNDLRHFFKKSLNNWLPQETITKKKQGFGLPFGVWMETHKPLQELAYDNLLKLKSRSYFKTDFIDNVIDLHRNQHAHYYGELIWVLMILELWIDSYNRPA
ncbi:MAG: asparagine synthase-related protein [Sedimenticola sp.]